MRQIFICSEWLKQLMSRANKVQKSTYSDPFSSIIVTVWVENEHFIVYHIAKAWRSSFQLCVTVEGCSCVVGHCGRM